MQRVVSFVSAVAFAVFLVVVVWIARLDRGGPAHADVALDGGVPATLYLPGSHAGQGRGAFLDPPPPEQRAPAVVVMHGFAGDRLSMSGISRRIAASGYAVLNIDATGHGQNRNPYTRRWATSDAFHEDMRAAVDFLRSHPFVDGSRLAVLGHSMGAGAALDYATRDAALDAAVMVSGGWRLEGPYRPANALFIYAVGDPDRVRERSDELAARLAGVAQPERDHTYGRHDRHDAVRVVEVAGANHQTIVWREEAVREIVAWLDAAFGVERTPAPTPADPRVPALALLGIAFVLVLPGLGLVVGRLAPAAGPRPGEGRALGLAALAAAFALTMPLLATGTPAEILSVAVADVLVAHFALAGIVLLVAIRLRRPELLEGLFQRPGATLLCAGVAVIGFFVLVQPFAVVMHRVTLTPERTAVFVMAVLGFLPLALAFNLLLRRGPTPSATLCAVAGRVLVLLVLVAGVRAGVLAEVLLFMLPALAIVSLLFEVFACAVYAASGNLLAISVVDAAWLAIVAAAIMPIRV